ncbi:phosphotransferase enzyme family protein [Verrucomicrobiota bacterium]
MRTGKVFPVAYSILSSDRLAEEVQSYYPLAAPVSCDPLHLGLNDTYLIRTGDESYVLRVYRAGWRSPEDIHYELDLLAHLRDRGVPVATPVARRNGDLMRLLPAPEGTRPAVLFTYASGKRPAETAPYVHTLGRAIGRLHAAADGFTSRHARFPLDLGYFLDHPVRSLRPVLASRPGDWNDLVAIVEEVRACAERIPLTALDWGPCHGDIDWKHLHVADDQSITLFDFDNGGPGWRSFDLATFRVRTSEESVWNGFLEGYRTERPVSDQDLHAIPLFMVMLRIYMLGFAAVHRDNTPWGAAMVRDGFIDDELASLREWIRLVGRNGTGQR